MSMKEENICWTTGGSLGLISYFLAYFLSPSSLKIQLRRDHNSLETFEENTIECVMVVKASLLVI